MGPPPSCPIKLWYIHSAVANTYKEEIESFFPLLRPQSLSCDIRLTACDGKKRNIFVSLSFWSMTEVVINIWQGPLYHFFIKVVDFWSLLEIEFPEATYATTCITFCIQHQKGSIIIFQRFAHEIPFGREQQQRNTSNTEQKSLSCYVFSSISFLVIFLHITWLWYDDGTLSILSKAFVFTM